MSLSVSDGTGDKYRAKVDSFNRLWTDNISKDAEEDAARQGNAFIFHAECHLKGALNGGLMYITNTSTTKNIAITRIFFDAHILTNPMKIYQVKKPATIANGTDVSISGTVNKNFNSKGVIPATFVISDGASDMTYTGGSNFHAFSLQSMESKFRDMRGTNIITKDQTWLIGWESLDGVTNATDAETISMSINVYTYDV